MKKRFYENRDRKIQMVDSALIQKLLFSDDKISINDGNMSDTYLLSTGKNSYVLKIADHACKNFDIEEIVFGPYKKDKNSSDRHNFESQKLKELYIQGYNVVEPVDASIDGIVLTKFHPGKTVLLHENISINTYRQIAKNLFEMHEGGIYHGDPHVGNVFYDKNLTWFDFDTELLDDVNFIEAKARDLLILTESIFAKTDNRHAVRSSFELYKDDRVKSCARDMLDYMDEDYAGVYVKAGRGDLVKLRNILRY